MKVAFLFDPGNRDGTKGGAELTMEEFIAAAPDEVEVGQDADGLENADAVVVGNCVSYAADTIQGLEGKRVIRYHHDLAYHEHPELREWLNENAVHIFTSPLHLAHHELDDGHIIPPAIDLAKFRPPRQHRRHGKRSGAVTVGAWQNPGKGQNAIREWSDRTGQTVDIYGIGELVPYGPKLNIKGPLAPDDVPGVLWRYERFLHLPTVIEPFGRAVVEAHAAGCTVVLNELVGAKFYIEQAPDKLESAADEFWEVVCG